MVKISVISVCRNDIEGLRQTFDSIQAQDCKDSEWWVIDGNSTDGTVEWLRTNHQLKGGWISEPDNGIYDAMNKGIGVASGEYLVFMNSGDMLAESDVISKLINRIGREKESPDFVYGDALDIATSGKSYYRKALPVSRIKFGMITRHQAMLYRRELAVNQRYPSNFKLSADYALTASILMEEGVKALQVDFPICRFYLGGAHDTQRLKALYEDFEIRRKILKQNHAKSLALFCVHWLHHYVRRLVPSLNRLLIYKR